ncbi:MAG: RNA polymerase sigma factor [Marinoscillum sp.]
MSRENYNKLSDEEIIANLIKQECTEMFEVLYNRYHTKVLNKCYSFVKNRELAGELAGDIFSKTYEKLQSFKHNSSFSSWLYSITYNHCIDYLRIKKKLHYPQWNSENEMAEIVDDSDEAISDLSYENLMVIMELIHPEEKALLLMKYQDELSIKDISKALRISDNATKMRLKRARTRVIYLYKKKYKTDD